MGMSWPLLRRTLGTADAMVRKVLVITLVTPRFIYPYNWGLCDTTNTEGRGIHHTKSRYTAMKQSQVISLTNTLRPTPDGRHFPDDIFKCIFLNENAWICNKIPLKFVPEGPINNIPTLLQIMTWRRPGDKPLSEPMIVSLPTHVYVTRPQSIGVN